MRVKQHEWLTVTLGRIGLFVVFASAVYLIAIQHQATRAYSDQRVFHYPTIMHFVAGGTLGDYPSATSPGFHLLLAHVGRFTSSSLQTLQFINLAISACLLIVLSRSLAVLQGHKALLLLPLFTSIYWFLGMVWLLPDNLSWLLVFSALFSGAWLFERSDNAAHHMLLFMLFALLLAANVFVRQTTIWLCVIPGIIGIRWLYIHVFKRLYRVTAAETLRALIGVSSAMLLPVLVLLYLVLTWKGLVPPSFQAAHQRMSGSVPAFFFSVLGVYATFIAPLLFSTWRERCMPSRRYWQVALLAAAVLMLYSMNVASDYNYNAGRYSGLWNVAKLLPNIGEHSVFIALASAWGAIVFVSLCWLLPQNPRWYIISISFAFICALLPNALVYERYIAGFVYFFLYFVLSKLPSEYIQWHAFSKASLWLFVAFNAGVTGLSIMA